MILVFDTETNGKPINYKAAKNDTSNWPRVVQLAWAVFTHEGALVRGRQQIIKPDGWSIPDEVVAIHGISEQKANADGVPMLIAIRDFVADYESCDTLVAHNIGFDYPVLGCEMIRYQIRPKNKIERHVCTMNASTDFCKLPGGYGKYKWPKLMEVHQLLFKEGFDGAHDAMNDVLACGRVFFELRRLGIICNACGGATKQGVALQNSLCGSPEFLDGDMSGATLSASVDANLINCTKCGNCGHSFVLPK